MCYRINYLYHYKKLSITSYSVKKLILTETKFMLFFVIYIKIFKMKTTSNMFEQS